MSGGRDEGLSAIRERDFQRWVIDLARTLGWRVWHVPAPMQWDSSGRGKGFVGARDAAGLADLIMVHVQKRFVYFAEVKGKSGKLSGKQTEFLEAITAVGDLRVRSFAWWPGDEEEIEQLLARPKAPPADTGL